jgi:hypothetical protein
MVQVVGIGPDTFVANMVAQHGYATTTEPVAIRYDALAECLGKIGRRLEPGTTIHMPRIGCGLAGGRWERVEPLIEEHLCERGFAVCVYDLPATL